MWSEYRIFNRNKQVNLSMRIRRRFSLQYAIQLVLAATAIAYAPLNGCTPQLYVPNDDHAVWIAGAYNTELSVSELEQARTMYTQYCQTCHYLHMPKEYTIAEWNTIFPVMAEKISVTDSVKQKMMYYVMAEAKDVGKK